MMGSLVGRSVFALIKMSGVCTQISLCQWKTKQIGTNNPIQSTRPEHRSTGVIIWLANVEPNYQPTPTSQPNPKSSSALFHYFIPHKGLFFFISVMSFTSGNTGMYRCSIVSLPQHTHYFLTNICVNIQNICRIYSQLYVYNIFSLWNSSNQVSTLSGWELKAMW